SHAAPADPAASPITPSATAATSPRRLVITASVRSRVRFAARARAPPARAAPRPAPSPDAARRPPPQQEAPAPRATHQLALARPPLPARHRQHWRALEREAVERVVAGARVQPALVDDAGARGVEQDEVRVAADRDRPLLRIQAEDARGVGREGADEGG